MRQPLFGFISDSEGHTDESKAHHAAADDVHKRKLLLKEYPREKHAEQKHARVVKGEKHIGVLNYRDEVG